MKVRQLMSELSMANPRSEVRITEFVKRRGAYVSRLIPVRAKSRIPIPEMNDLVLFESNFPSAGDDRRVHASELLAELATDDPESEVRVCVLVERPTGREAPAIPVTAVSRTAVGGHELVLLEWVWISYVLFLDPLCEVGLRVETVSPLWLEDVLDAWEVMAETRLPPWERGNAASVCRDFHDFVQARARTDHPPGMRCDEVSEPKPGELYSSLFTVRCREGIDVLVSKGRDIS
jgi:hypothetical protein